MKLDADKPLETNYKNWLDGVKEEAKFLSQAWAHSAETEFAKPSQSKRFLQQLEPELPTSYTASVDGTVDNLSRIILQDARIQVTKDAMNQKWSEIDD